ncbi:MAG: hypothetical protein FWB86_01225 [Treponema sp.]|nr:hypothetical protein [Treponema sp.]MCL2250394.1 hypothetical protein [Treponema sp.]
MNLYKSLLLIFLFISIFFTTCVTTAPKAFLSSGNFVPVKIPLDFFGMVHAGNSGTTEEYQLLNELGAIWLLQTFYWGRIEREKDHFNFTMYDNFVNIAKENNKKVIAVMAYDTPWIKSKGEKRRYISPENITHFLNFLEVTVRHFKGKVDVWQIWNEPNFKFWNGTNKEFYELSKLAAQRIRETDPDAYIIGGGYSRVPKNFIRGMYKAGAMENLDAISFHPYAMTPIAAMRLHDKFIDILSEINFTKEVWITEMGYPTAGWYPHKVSLNNLPSYIIKTVVGAAIRNPRVFCWYELFDSHNHGKAPSNFDSEMFFGLVYPDHSWKDGAFSYSLCANFLPGSYYFPELPKKTNIPSNIVSYCFMDGASGYNTLIMWNDRNSSQKIKISLSTSFTLHDISSGNNVVMQNDSIINITNKPVFITWQDTDEIHITRVTR